MQWGNYEPFDPESWGPLQDLPREEARRAFDRLMAARGERIEQLRQLLALQGLELRSDDPSVQELNDWFVDSAERDPRRSTKLEKRWFSVVNDVALYLGELLIERSSGRLRWEFFIGDRSTGDRSNVSCQRHVLMGFSRAANPNYRLDVDRLVAAAVRDALSRKEKDRASARSAFRRLLASGERWI